MNRFERHRGRTIAVLWIAILGVALVATEAVLRSTEDLAVSQPGLGSLTPQRYVEFREWQPGMKFRAAPPQIRRDNPGGPVLDVYPMDIDGDGFIMPSRVYTKPDLTIVFLGGSTTETMYVAPETRFPYLVGRLLEQRTGLKINSFNAGRSGNNAMLSSAVMLGKLLPLHPDYVVIMSNGTDLGVLSRFGTYWNDSSDFAVVRPERRGVERGGSLVRDALIPGIYRAYRRAALRVRTWRKPTPPPPLPAVPPASLETQREEWPEWGRDYGSALQQLIETARAWRVRSVIMTEPVEVSDPTAGQGEYRAASRLDGGEFSAAGFADAHEYFNGIAREVAAESKAGLVDLMALGGWSRRELYDGMHFNDAGSQRAAAAIAEALEAMIKADRLAQRAATN
jgi:lysophospholipase L1-like esterase